MTGTSSTEGYGLHSFMLWGYCVNWGRNDCPDDPAPTVQEYKWDPATYVDPYKQYKETNKQYKETNKSI